MENIFPLILIIIVFNVISAILKALRGGKGVAEKAALPVYVQPEQKVKINPWADHSLDETALEPDYETLKDETESYLAPIPLLPPLPEEVYRRPPVQKVESARGTRATTDGKTGYDDTGQSASPANVFASKNAFLSAYIFHEVLQPPVSMRKKR